MNPGRKRTKHIDKEKKKIIYLTPCCLHTFLPPLPLLLQALVQWCRLVCYKQPREMQPPFITPSDPLVYLKTHIKHFNDQMMKHNEWKEEIWFSQRLSLLEDSPTPPHACCEKPWVMVGLWPALPSNQERRWVLLDAPLSPASSHLFGTCCCLHIISRCL